MGCGISTQRVHKEFDLSLMHVEEDVVLQFPEVFIRRANKFKKLLFESFLIN